MTGTIAGRTLPAAILAAALAGSAAEPPPLTVVTGPRQSAWKRVFNPFRPDPDSRFPAAAGVYEPLLVYIRATGSYQPWLATSYEWAANNTKLRMPLRSGVVWSDGAPFSARDVVFTFELMRRVPSLDRDEVWSYLGAVSAPDPGLVEFTFKRAYTPGLIHIGHQPIVPEHVWKGIAQPASFDDPNPVATGPFTQVLRFEPALYELGRNPRYWQKGKPGAAALRVPRYETNEEITRALEEGNVHWASLFLPDIERNYVAKDPARRAYWYPDNGPPVLLFLNAQRKPLDDANVRKAFSMAVDRPRILKEALDDYAPPADATALPEAQKRWKDPALTQSAHWTRRDVVEANRLLDAAGLARGSDGVRTAAGAGPMRYDLHVVQGWTDWVAAASIIRQNLAEVGVSVSVRADDYNDWLEALRRGRFEMGLWFGDRGPTPYEFYRGQMDPLLVRPVGESAVADFHRFGSKEAGVLLRRFETSSDPQQLEGLAHELEKLYVENAPSVPLYASPLWGVFNTSQYGGFPTRYAPYSSAAPGGTDTLPALVEIKPR